MDGLPPQSIEALLASLNCGALLLDRKGTILIANQRLVDMMGSPPACLKGRRFAEIYEVEEDRERVRARLAEFGTAREGEFYLPRVDGSRAPVILSSRPLGMIEPLSSYMVVTAIDISRQKAAESKLSEDYRTIAQLSDTVLNQALDLKHYSEGLEQMVRERTEEIREANMESIYMLAVASEARDADTGAHVRRIQSYTEQLARELRLPPTDVERFGYSAILHDVGKIVVPDQVLKKPGQLTIEERSLMQQHAPEGERILSDKPFFEIAREIARSHHENWDGSGYPDGLSGESIRWRRGSFTSRTCLTPCPVRVCISRRGRRRTRPGRYTRVAAGCSIRRWSRPLRRFSIVAGFEARSRDSAGDSRWRRPGATRLSSQAGPSRR